MFRRGAKGPARRSIAALLSVRRGPLAAGVRRWKRLAGRLRLRRRGLTASPGQAVITVRGQVRAALVSPTLTPLEARGENARMVCEALEEAGIDYFHVRGYENNASVVGVSAEHRPQVLDALMALARRTPGYLSHVPGRPGDALYLARDPRARETVADAPHFRFSCFRTTPSRTLVLGVTHGCDVEFWEPEGDRLTAPRSNRAADSVLRDGPPVTAPGERFTRLASRHSRNRPVPVTTREECLVPLPDDIDFPVDVVYTWVDGGDEAWRRRRAAVLDEPYHPEAANDARYLCRDELRYSLRSLHAYAPWVRDIYLVTDAQVPSWLEAEHPGLTVVDHRDIFTDPDALPTFNSHAIESQLHHIGELSEHFLYFNDDVFLGNPVMPGDFFVANGMAKFYLSRALLPSGPLGPDTPPVSVAGRNNQNLIRDRFGTVPTRKVKHLPHPLLKSVLAEIESTFPLEHRTTAANRIRSRTDISVPSSLHHYYAFHTGRSVEANLRYDYYDLALPDIESRLQTLLRRRNQQAFCLNDTVSASDDQERQAELLRTFLTAYFPTPGPFERPLQPFVTPQRETDEHRAPAPHA